MILLVVSVYNNIAIYYSYILSRLYSDNNFMFYLYRRPAGVEGIIFYFVLYLTCAAKGRASINFIEN